MSVRQILHFVRTNGMNLEGDWADELHLMITSNFLLAAASVTAAKNMAGSPLQCASSTSFPGSWTKCCSHSPFSLVSNNSEVVRLNLSPQFDCSRNASPSVSCIFPSKFSSSLQEYAENLCWSESTYFVEPTVHVATLADEARYTPERKLSYYQWVPFALLLQAACFRFPSILWRLFSINSGLRIHEIVTRALDPANMEEATRQRNIEILSKHIAHALSFQKRRSRRNAFIYRPFKFLNTYLTSFVSMAYLVTKLLYAFNVVVQLYLLNKFLQTDRAGYQFFGYGVVKDLLSGIEWESSGFFPRVSICDFTVRQVANIQKYSVQCVLVIFILLWFWYLLLFVVTMLSLVYWLFVLICPCFGRWYISTNLELHESEAVDIRKDRKSVNKFVHEYLKQDGVFVLRMVTLHAGILFGTELVMHLYKIFAGIHEQKHAPPKTKPNHYVTNKEEYLRRRKHKKNTTLDPDEIVTTLLPEVISKQSSSSSSSSSSDSDRRSKSDQSDDDLKKSKSDKSIV